ncbi:hypothetical protein [Thermococcus sp.]|uniref:hypothetical protein n=1 Tax=Thermococcus sp. TaxID=35749 RepID=UPI0026360421|nr:hypothetical protein [Thermococcus sp.]
MNTRENLERVLFEFNRLHGSEAEVRILNLEGNEVIIEFEGSFCATCGLYDYFEDIKWEAIELGVELEPIDVLEAEEDGFEHGRYVVRYKLGERPALSVGDNG